MVIATATESSFVSLVIYLVDVHKCVVVALHHKPGLLFQASLERRQRLFPNQVVVLQVIEEQDITWEREKEQRAIRRAGQG